MPLSFHITPANSCRLHLPQKACWKTLETQILFFVFVDVGGQLLYSVGLASTVGQSESAVGVRISLPFWIPFP